jgi:hypothetical protein
MMNYAIYPLKDIPEPHPHDVLCGRGGGTNAHVGNSHWRMLVAANKQLYITLPKRQKMLLSRSIVNAVRSQNPPGRFLQKDNKSNLWFDVGDQRAQEKTSQALREGAPDIRKKVAEQQEQEPALTTPNKEIESVVEGTSGNMSNSGETDKEGGQHNKNNINNNNSNNDDDNNKQQEQPSTGDNKTTALAPQQQGDRVMPPSSQPPQYGNYPSAQQQQQLFASAAAAAVNMQMMYPTMVMDDHGVMVPNTMMMTPQQQQYMMQMMMNGGGGAMPHHNNQMHNYHHQQQQQQHYHHNTDHDDNFEPLPVDHHDHQGDGHNNMNNTTTPTFDEFVQAPDSLEPAGMSYGSVGGGAGGLTETEVRRLLAVTGAEGSSGSSIFDSRTSMGSMNGITRSQTSIGENIRDLNAAAEVAAAAAHAARSRSNNDHDDHSDNRHNNNIEPVPAALGRLEPTGISFGDMSMMSTGTNMMRLEDTGTSFGTMMSFGTAMGGGPDMVDGGLMAAVGTSFGSLSLDPKNREALFRTLELTAGGPEIPPMFHSEEKATGNLLDCSDTESESSEDKHKLTMQKSQAWERMKSQIATETILKQQGSKDTIGSTDMMPPPVGVSSHYHHQQHQQQPASSSPTAQPYFVDTEVAVPTTALENNFSTLSVWSAADDFDAAALYDVGGDADDGAVAPPLPRPLKKEDSW